MEQAVLSLFILTTIYFIPNTSPVFAQSKVLINEFLIDPQPQSVEIFNSGTESADISDWIIDDSGGTTFFTIPKESIVFSNQCLVFSSDFNLNKTTTDVVRLINSSQQLIDSFSYKSSSGSGISYLRLPDGSNLWSTGSANLGLYNQTNISCLATPSPTLIPSGTITPTEGSVTPDPYNITATPTPIQLTPTDSTDSTDSTDLTNIYLSEVMVNPPTGEKEWLEIYNDNDFAVLLNNWFVDDLENAGSSQKIFTLEISAKSYGIFDLTSSMFNNDGDSVRLLDFNKDLKDDFEYQITEQGKTLGRISFDSDDFCLQEPSKNSVNNSCIYSSPTPIVPTPTVIIILSSTIKSIPSGIPITKANNFDVSIHRSINYPTGSYQTNHDNGDVLGITSNTINNPSLIKLLTILSTSYSLLTIISILFKMKLSYGKNNNFYSSSFHTS